VRLSADARRRILLTSTVPMGADSDPTAVVDACGKGRVVEALHVVEAPILPDIPSVATNVTTIMVAERIAAKLMHEHSVLEFQRIKPEYKEPPQVLDRMRT
jgi:choline dehydrogenase-like flavoprotein